MLSAASLSLALVNGFWMLSGPARAIGPDDDPGVFGSVTVAQSARDAAKALKSGDYAGATDLYRRVISKKGDFVDFYYGLLYSAQKASQWDQVSQALDNLAEKDPAAKPHLAYEYGHCYAMTNRPDEAVPFLKLALTNTSRDNSFLIEKVHELQNLTDKKAPPLHVGDIDSNGNIVQPPPPDRVAFVPPKVDLIPGAALNPDDTKNGADFENAFRMSEWIGVCTYKGYQKKEDIGYFNPPTANFYWTECLKGPPLNHQMPIKFKFYDVSGAKMPEGWSFSADKMPKVGSRWLIFLRSAIPVKGGFDTYKGDYGRKEADEKNMGEIYRIIEAHHGQ